MLVGDVQGKGLAAVEVTGLMLSAFRRAVRARIPLAALPGFLDTNLRQDLVDIAEDGDPDCAWDKNAEPGPRPAGDDGPPPLEAHFLERFVTAVVIDIASDGSTVEVVNSGHPPPLLIHGRAVRALLPDRPELPLGLGDLTGQTQHVDTYGLDIGDIILLYTDGVIEARDARGTFYPLTERLARWAPDGPQSLLETIKTDLFSFVDTRLADDVAMVAVQRVS